MAAALRRLNEKWRALGKQPFRAGMGLHTCNVLIGNIGDDRKKTFTVMGEEVDKAIELESLTKKYQAKIIMTERAAEASREAHAIENVEPDDAERFGRLFDLDALHSR